MAKGISIRFSSFRSCDADVVGAVVVEVREGEPAPFPVDTASSPDEEMAESGLLKPLSKNDIRFRLPSLVGDGDVVVQS